MRTRPCTECGDDVTLTIEADRIIESYDLPGALCNDCAPEYDWTESECAPFSDV